MGATGADSEGFGGDDGRSLVEPHFHSNSNFHGKYWINLINLGYRTHPKYSHPPLTFYPILIFNKYEIADELQTV